MKKIILAFKFIWNVLTNIKFFYRITGEIIRTEREKWKIEKKLNEKKVIETARSENPISEDFKGFKPTKISNTKELVFGAFPSGKLTLKVGEICCKVSINFLPDRKKSADYDPFTFEIHVPDNHGAVWSHCSFILPHLLTDIILKSSQSENFELMDWSSSDDTVKNSFLKNCIISGIRGSMDHDGLYKIRVGAVNYGVRCKGQQPEISIAGRSNGKLIVRVKKLFFWEYDENDNLLDVNEIPEFYLELDLFDILPIDSLEYHSANQEDMENIDDPSQKKPILFIKTNKKGTPQESVQLKI